MVAAGFGNLAHFFSTTHNYSLHVTAQWLGCYLPIEWHGLVEDRIRVAELDTSFTSAYLASTVILSLWHMQQLSHTYTIML